jgi:hypothetical protein
MGTILHNNTRVMKPERLKPLDTPWLGVRILVVHLKDQLIVMMVSVELSVCCVWPKRPNLVYICNFPVPSSKRIPEISPNNDMVSE